ncbi:MAG TPA: RNA 2',3'-cyclic phosphodiesterase [Acidobacteriota bacterium]|nr:RNA 2',3'-cyclic phosphodiesterase [Acidobacteriota bacterium]
MVGQRRHFALAEHARATSLKRMSVQRLFVALTPPPPVREDIAALADELEGVRWTAADNLHLTLRFLGDTPEEKRLEMESALTRVRVEPFVLPVGGLGVFPPRGPAKVLWAGVGSGHTRLYQLRKQVDEALLSVDMTLDVRNFSPHFTVARLSEAVEPKHLGKYLYHRRNFEAPPFRVTSFELYASELQPGRAPVYRMIRSFALEA